MTASEPSAAAYEELRRIFQVASNVEVLHAPLGHPVARATSPERTLHFANFVVNCLDSPALALDLLAQSAKSGETAYVFTNIFAPKELTQGLDVSDPYRALAIDLRALTLPQDRRPPTIATFENRIVGTDTVLIDSVHVIDEYERYLGANPDCPWHVLLAELMPPCGFIHLDPDAACFGSYRFSVMVLKLQRR